MAPRVKLCVPTEESFPLPLKYIDVTRTTDTTLHVRPPDGDTWSGVRLTRKQTTSRPDNVWPDMWKHMSDASKRKEKQKWTIEKPKLDYARRLCGNFFIEVGDEEFKRVKENARRKLEIPMPAAMLCRLQLNQHRETCGKVGQHMTKYACTVEADESMRRRMEGSQSKNNEDHTAGKNEFIESLQSCAQIFLCLKSRNTRCKVSSG